MGAGYQVGLRETHLAAAARGRWYTSNARRDLFTSNQPSANRYRLMTPLRRACRTAYRLHIIRLRPSNKHPPERSPGLNLDLPTTDAWFSPSPYLSIGATGGGTSDERPSIQGRSRGPRYRLSGERDREGDRPDRGPSSGRRPVGRPQKEIDILGRLLLYIIFPSHGRWWWWAGVCLVILEGAWGS